MKILLVSNYTLDKQYSMLKYATWLEKCLKDGDVIVRRLAPPVLFGRILPSSQLNKWLRHIDKLVIGAIHVLVVSRQYDVAHITDHSNAILGIVCLSPIVTITCHDVIAIKASRGGFSGVRLRRAARLYQLLVLRGLGRVDNIICASSNTSDEVRALLPSADITTIEHPLNRHFDLHCPRLKSEKPFILHIGGATWYKNRDGVIRLFAVLRSNSQFQDHQLVLAGRRLTDSEKALAIALDVSTACVEIVDPEDDRIDNLYRSADCLLFPSRYEGFGWPIIEARALGCPIITSNIPPMSEIGGPFALFIDPAANPVENAQKIIDGWEQLQRRAGENRQGMEAFSPELASERYRKFFREFLPNVKK
jgi:glycosyltransferase involved in cell wall biosynthesis